MELEHPIPQQISSYQFRLVGDMTLKQFFQVAGGTLLSLVIYSSGLPAYVKWPLILVVFLGGIAFAFFPLQDRPLSQWLLLFFKAIYSPTIYVWRKSEKRPEYFQKEPSVQSSSAEASQFPQLATKSKESYSSLPEGTPQEVNRFEIREREFLDKVSAHFQDRSQASPISTASTKVQTVFVQPQAGQALRPGVTIPKIIPKTVEKTENVILVTQSTPTDVAFSQVGSNITPIAAQQMSKDTKSVVFAPEAAPPLPPSKPNVVVGQVMDSTGKIIENAILEIKDSEGRSARALRSNKLGHFMIVTPLSPGNYEIITEKEGFLFDPASFVANDNIIPPISIKSK